MATTTHTTTEVTLGRATFSETVETWFEVVAATMEGRVATYELLHRETGVRGVVTVTPKMRGLGGKFEYHASEGVEALSFREIRELMRYFVKVTEWRFESMKLFLESL